MKIRWKYCNNPGLDNPDLCKGMVLILKLFLQAKAAYYGPLCHLHIIHCDNTCLALAHPCGVQYSWWICPNVWHKWLKHRKNPSVAVTWTPRNIQSRHASCKPHTYQDGTFFVHSIILKHQWLLMVKGSAA